MRVHRDRLVVLKKTRFPLDDGGLDGGDGVGAQSLVIDGVEDDIGIHLVHLRTRCCPIDAGELAALESDVRGGDVLAVE